MMKWLRLFVLVTTIYCGGGVTKPSGIEQFWTDDYKVFEQVYGKTSDKEIYGTKLPPSISFAEPKGHQASEKKERYLLNYPKESEEFDPYNFGDKYNLLSKPAQKKPTSTFNFVSYNDFKPISQNSDPETYNYLKHLEEEEEREKSSELVKGTGGFKPYMNYVGPNPEETDAYKSIQEILDAHEANKGKGEEDDGNSKYLTYREKNNRKATKKKPTRNASKVSKPRCLPGRCRNRSSVSYRVRTRPYYRRIKHTIY